MKTKVFVVLVVLILISIPVMREWLYEYSKVQIRRINLLYKTPWLTQIMQCFDVMATGELYAYLMIFLYSIGKKTEFAFFFTCYFINAHSINTLKLILHETRPQFDDSDLAEDNAVQCSSGDFGSPSGHTQLTSQFMIQALLYYQGIYKPYLDKNRFQSVILTTLTWGFVICVSFCRLYLGRHSIDQILLGNMLGIVTAYYLNYNLKAPFFQKYEKTTAYDVKVTFTLAFLAFTQVVACFLYVEYFVELPKHWYTQIAQLCPVVRKMQLFQHSSLATAGYYFITPFLFFWRFAKGKTENRKVSWCEAVLRLALVGASDYLMTDFVPLGLYQTKDLDIIPDILIKRIGLFFLLSLSVEGPADRVISQMFSTK